MDFQHLMGIFESFILLWIIYGQTNVISLKIYEKEVCIWESFNPVCDANSVIIIKEAQYGRFKVGSCKVEEDENLGCHEDVHTEIELNCSGRRSCVVKVAYADFFNIKPCGELNSYLLVTYYCTPVVKSSSGLCQSCDGILVKEPDGYISNIESEETGCGLTECPWRLKAPKGQTINITLQDYSYVKSPNDNDVCKAYAELKEPSKSKPFTVCGKTSSRQLVYSSLENVLDIHILNTNPSSFLLYYEFIGCPDLVRDAMTFIRFGNVATLQCNDIDREFSLMCRENEWVGEITNCFLKDPDTMRKTKSAFIVTVEMIIIITSCVSFTIGGCILILGIYIFCRERKLLTETKKDSTFSKNFEECERAYKETWDSIEIDQKCFNISDNARSSMPTIDSVHSMNNHSIPWVKSTDHLLRGTLNK